MALFPSHGASAAAFWATPRPGYPGGSVALVSNASSGDVFPLGASVVAYTASVTGPVGLAAVSCSFVVTVHGAWSRGYNMNEKVPVR